MVHRLGKGEVVHPRIAQSQFKQLQKGDWASGPIHNIQDQQLQVQIVLDKSDHSGVPSSQYLCITYYSLKLEKEQEKNRPSCTKTRLVHKMCCKQNP